MMLAFDSNGRASYGNLAEESNAYKQLVACDGESGASSAGPRRHASHCDNKSSKVFILASCGFA